MKQRSRIRLLLAGAALVTTAVFASNPSGPTTITEQRLLDQRIQADVMNVLANDTELSGRVVVESKDQVVNLSGYLKTSGQVWRAGRAASRVQGVKSVVNEIRTQLGPVTN